MLPEKLYINIKSSYFELLKNGESMLGYIDIGRKIYNMQNPREVHRFVVFAIRCLLHPFRMKRLEKFFHSTPLMEKIAAEYGFVYEQPTRAFFYNKSTFSERATLVEEHMEYLAEHVKEQDFLDLYAKKEKLLWQSTDEGAGLRLVLSYHPGQRKEGLLSLVLSCDEGELYQMIFWIAKDRQREWSLWIGAMQGPNMENAREIIKKVTKRCHAYRTKNLILHVTQEIARALRLKHIYAVTNYGYYANNHIRRDRKLKTDFSQFWQESGGTPCKDLRFFELPLKEYRKTMEEIPTRKRANYRKRFQMLDEIDESILVRMKRLMK
jgi:hypothetical protein